MARRWRLPLLLSLWTGLATEVLAGSRTVPVQVTFVDVVRLSASLTLNAYPDADRMEPGGRVPRLLADLKLEGVGERPLSIVVETPGNPGGLRSAEAAPTRRSSDDLIVTISYH